MATVKDVLKGAKSKNRSERAGVAQKYPNIVTSSHEEIYEAMLSVVSAEQLEVALMQQDDISMSSELERELKRTMAAHTSLPSGVAPRIKTLDIDEETGNIVKKPGRPSAEHKRLLEQREQLRRDPSEEEEAFALVKSYPLSVTASSDDDDDDDDWKSTK